MVALKPRPSQKYLMQNKLRIAMIGAAGKVAAPCHLNALQNIDRVNLCALCDSDKDRLDVVSQQHSVKKVYTNFESVLADNEIDAVDIVVPPFLHADMAIATAQAGKHIYVEKPMSRSVGEARKMIDAADIAGVQLMVGESYYFHGAHQLAHRLIQQGEIGEILQVRQTKAPWVFTETETQRLDGRGHDVAWRFDPTLSGGGSFPWMMDHGPHLFATARLLAGKQSIDQVVALARNSGYGPEKHLRGITAVSWTYAHGAADGVWTHVENKPEGGRYIGFRTEVMGTHGTLLAFGEGGGAAPGFAQVPPVTIFKNGTTHEFELDEPSDRSWVSNNSYYDQAHTHALQHFADSILDGNPLEYDGNHGLLDITATLATIQSAIKGHAVRLEDVKDDWTPNIT